MSKFTIEIQAPELANAITALANAFGGQVVSTPVITQVVTEVKEVKESEEKQTKIVEETTKAEKPKKAEEVKIAETDVRAKFVELTKKGKKEELKSLLTEFEVAKVSDLKPEQYADVMAKLEAM